MAITLAAMVRDDTVKTGDDQFILAAGKALKVETSPQGSELLNVEVPAGKQWDVVVYVRIVETNA